VPSFASLIFVIFNLYKVYLNYFEL
jgi:hypothetical protein